MKSPGTERLGRIMNDYGGIEGKSKSGQKKAQIVGKILI